jgi:membrane-associated phospholipid phosphatase
MEAGLPEVAARRLDAKAKYEVRVVLVAIAVALVGIPFGLLLQQVTTDGPLTALDESAAVWTNRHVRGEDGVIGLMEIVSFLGKPVFLAVAVGLPGIWLLRHGAHKLVVFLAVTSIGGGIVDTIVKVAVGRSRPVHDQPIIEAFGQSFPSGHSMSSVVCYGALLVVFVPVLSDRVRRLAIAAVVVLVLAIGASRLVLGVHFISDVVGGYVLGAAWLLGSVAAFETWRADRGRRTTHPLSEGVEPEETRDLVST